MIYCNSQFGPEFSNGFNSSLQCGWFRAFYIHFYKIYLIDIISFYKKIINT